MSSMRSLKNGSTLMNHAPKNRRELRTLELHELRGKIWCPTSDLHRSSPRYECGASLSKLDGRIGARSVIRTQFRGIQIRCITDNAYRAKWCRREDLHLLPP